MIEDIIEKYYKLSNFANYSKLFDFIRINEPNLNISRNQIKDYLDKKKETELLKIKLKPKHIGHIIAHYYKNMAQADIYDLSKYSRSNHGNKYLLVVMDVFTRKAFISILKTKSMDDVFKGFTNIFKKYVPNILTMDSDSSFLSSSIQALFQKHNIIPDFVIAQNDHKALGIIDRFALTLKRILSKLFIINDSTNWIDHIDTVIDNYNNSPHSSLHKLSPNQANSNFETIKLINQLKSGDNKLFKSIFKKGDIVRLRIQKTFRKGSEPRYSDELYNIIDVKGRRVKLDDGRIVLDTQLIKTNFKLSQQNIIEKNNLTNRIHKIHSRENILQQNIIPGKRKILKKISDEYIY